MALPAIVPAAGMVVKGAFSGITAATAALKAAVAAAAAATAGAAGSAAYKAAKGASAGARRGYSKEEYYARHARGARGYTKDEYYARAAKGSGFKKTTHSSRSYNTGRSAKVNSPGFFSKAWNKVKSSVSSLFGWIGGHKTETMIAASVGSSILTNSSYEGKKKRVSFSRATTIPVEGYHVQVPGVHIEKAGNRSYRSSYTRSRNDWNRPSYPRR